MPPVNTPKPTNPVAPQTPKAPTPPAPPSPAAAVATPEKPKKVRKEWTYFFDTEAAAVAEAKARDGGPRRPFVMAFNGTTYFVVAHNPEHAKSLIADKVGVTCAEVGKAPKPPKEVGIEGILSLLGAMNEADREAVQKALASLPKKA